MWFRWVGLMCVALCWPVSGHGAEAPHDGATEQAKVFRVFDGDRLLVRSRYHSQRVQLAGIDAPELDQPGGLRSQQILERMVLGKRVLLEAVGNNMVGEPLVRVTWHKYDINLEMLRAGAAWAGPDALPEQRAAEQAARAEGKGIWAPDQAAAIAPWRWRIEQGEEPGTP